MLTARARQLVLLGAMLAVIVATALAACGSTGPPPDHPSKYVQNVIPLPAGVPSATAPQPNGFVWVLSGTAHVRTATEVDISTGAKRTTLPLSSSAVAIAQSNTGQLAVALATKRSGAVELHSAGGGLEATIAVDARVRALAYGLDGNRLYVLDRGRRAPNLMIIDAVGRPRPLGSVGVPQDSVGVAVSPDQTAAWTLERDDNIEETSLASRRVLTIFRLIAPTPGSRSRWIRPEARCMCSSGPVRRRTSGFSTPPPERCRRCSRLQPTASR
jgi:hypothetical protein